MEVNRSDFLFWKNLEIKGKTKIPCHIKNIFHLCGFSNVLSFKDVDVDDIKHIEGYVSEELEAILQMKAAGKNEIYGADQRSIFFGVHSSNPSDFHFNEREIEMLQHLVALVKLETDHSRLEIEFGNLSINADIEQQFNNFPGPFFKDVPSNVGVNKSTNTDDLNSANLNRTHHILYKLLATADENVRRPKTGYRYDDEIKSFASYIRMLGGKQCYETIQANLPCALPTLSAVNKHIGKKNRHMVEGVLHTQALLEYLSARNAPKTVSLSEDGTRISGRIQYDAKTNQIIGFVLPIDTQTGMPVPYTYLARSAQEIYGHFSNENSVANFVNVVMAQPLGEHPPFCLLLFSSDGKFTTQDVSRRWSYITEELQKANVRVITTASDSDPRYNAAMRLNALLGHESRFFDNASWFKSGGMNKSAAQPPFYVQDPIHIATKLRNILLRTAHKREKLPFGKYFVSVQHLIYLLEQFPKDRHNLTWTTLNPTDKQNFASVMRICDRKVLELMKVNVKESQATVAFLQMLRDIVEAYLRNDLSPLERIRKIWFAVFVLRTWRESIITHKQFTLKDNFLTNNCYWCIELNAHSMVQILLYAKKNNFPSALLFHLMDSQACEAFFRKIRSFTSTYSTVANCSVKEILNRIDKIQLMGDISQTNGNIRFPRARKASLEYLFDLPTESEILSEIEKCKIAALNLGASVGFLNKKNRAGFTFECRIEPYRQNSRAARKPKLSKDINNMGIAKVDMHNLNLKDFSDTVGEICEDSPYVQVVSTDKRMVVKKTSLCWLLREESRKLSSDRLLRVRDLPNKIKRKGKFKVIATLNNPGKNKLKHRYC